MSQFFVNFNSAINQVYQNILTNGEKVDPWKWQGVEVKYGMIEYLWENFMVPVNHDIGNLACQCQADIPWADEHFNERISGQATNPGNSYLNWPYYADDSKWKEGDVFTHTYQERMWIPQTMGYRYYLGNLGDVILLLKRNPKTRQAFLPIWFPEDTGACHGGRVPCSIGYHFIIRNDCIHITYYIRSVDVIRHLHNDLYLAARLLIWVRNQVDKSLNLGYLNFNAISVHCFESDLLELKKRLNGIHSDRNN